jgi:hypothetical protein
MARQTVDPTWPLAVLFDSLAASEAERAGGDDGMMWVYDGRPLDWWRLEPLAAIRGSDYVLPFRLIPPSLWVDTSGGAMAEVRARFLPKPEPLFKRSRARSRGGALR